MKARLRAQGIHLRSRIPLQRASRLDFVAQPAGRNIKTVRPGQRTIFHEYPREICGITQVLDHETISVEDGCEIVLSRHAVAEGCPEPIVRRDCLIFATLIIIETQDLGDRQADSPPPSEE